jgi:hypothetical protein
VTETYIPLLAVAEGWHRDRVFILGISHVRQVGVQEHNQVPRCGRLASVRESR